MFFATLETIKMEVTLEVQWLRYSAAVTVSPVLCVGLRIFKEMRRALSFAIIILVANVAFMAAQNSNTVTSERKVTSRVQPSYPDLARKMRLQGVVRIEAVVKPNGTVKSTRVLGGNPVLVDAATDAVTKWKFETASGETTEIVQVTFTPQ